MSAPVIYGITSTGEKVPVRVKDTGKLEVDSEVTITAGDIQIGAVEIKDSVTEDRANVVANDVNSSVKGLVVLNPDGSKISRDAVQIRDANNNMANVVLSSVGLIKGLVVVNPDGTSITYGIPGTPFEPLSGYSNEIISTGPNIPNTAIITPTTGKRLVLKSIMINTEANRGQINLDFLTSAKKIFRVYPARSTYVFGTDLHIEGVVNEQLTLSGSGLNANISNFIAISFLEK